MFSGFWPTIFISLYGMIMMFFYEKLKYLFIKLSEHTGYKRKEAT